MTHTTQHTTARDFFYYLVLLVTLVWLVVATLIFSFSAIDTLIPDPLHPYRIFGMTGALASLIIVTPFFLFISAVINKDLTKYPEKKTLWVRKWLLYAVLFIAFLVAVVDLVVLLNSFLGGALSMRFALQTTVVLIVSGATFAYYLFELRRDPAVPTKVPVFAAVGVGVLIISAIVLGFSLVGNPVEQREKRFDMQRVNHLQNLPWQIDQHYMDNGVLPENLESLNVMIPSELRDPETGDVYGYSITGENTYELCATFTHPTDKNIDGYYYFDDSWEHQAGEVCFERTVESRAEF